MFVHNFRTFIEDIAFTGPTGMFFRRGPSLPSQLLDDLYAWLILQLEFPRHKFIYECLSIDDIF